MVSETTLDDLIWLLDKENTFNKGELRQAFFSLLWSYPIHDDTVELFPVRFNSKGIDTYNGLILSFMSSYSYSVVTK